MNQFMFLFDVEGLVVRKFELFPIHAGNDEHTIGARDVMCPGAGPSFFAERRRLGETPRQALELSRDLIEARIVSVTREIQVLQLELAGAMNLLRELG